MKTRKRAKNRLKPRPRPAKSFTVTPQERARLLAAIADADRGGSLPYAAAVAEVRRQSDEILEDFDEKDRTRLNAALRQSEADMVAGRMVDGRSFIAELRKKR